MVTGLDVAAEAEKLVGRRWLRNGRGTGITQGLDCVGLVVVAARNAGLKIKDALGYDVRTPGDDFMVNMTSENGVVCGPDCRDPGLVFMTSPRGFRGVSHMGIISTYDRVIHMDASRKCVVVDDFGWLDRNCIMTLKINGVD